MCGIAGILSPDTRIVSKERLQKMTDVIKHRGPEGDGFWINAEANVGLGHRRLSIIDLTETANQPMSFAERYTITYNGELYNYPEIKEALIKKGFQFKTASDTEVVLAAYAYYGKDCLQHFDGMFAFAIWDEEVQLLFCARDRFGEKPFYYHYSQTHYSLFFASEIKALWAAGVRKKADNEMLLNYLTLGWVQNPVNKQQTFFENIVSLPPSHYLIYKFSGTNEPYLEVRSYWDIDKETQLKDWSTKELEEKFLSLFTTSVQRRLRSDVLVGSSLSGGLDSSAIVATVQKLLNGPEKPKTFSAIFPGFEKDESANINQVIDQFGLENYTTTPTSTDLLNDLDELFYHQEEPFQSASIYAQYRVYKLAKEKGVTVILDGQGADETMAGYTKYYQWLWQEKIGDRKWKDAKTEMQLAKQNGQIVNWTWKNYAAALMPQLAASRLQTFTYKKQLTHPDITKDFLLYRDRTNIYKPVVSKLNDILYFNTMQFGLEELLRYADRNSMAHSREVRLPFLNHELVQFLFSLPSHQKISGGFTKHILRLAMQQVLPASIVWRKDKVGFEPPQKQWMHHAPVQELIMESRRKLVGMGMLRKEVLQKPVKPQSAHEADNFDWYYLSAAFCI